MSRIAFALRLSAIFAAFGLLQALRAQAADSLPAYEPHPVAPGVIKIYGSGMNGMVAEWEKGFRRFQPGVQFENRFPSSDGWSAGMEAAGADIGASGREPVLTEYLSFDETFGYDPTEVAVATGAYDKKGKTWAIIIYVNKDNPLTELPMAQLDGIFGAQRTGGYKGYKWDDRVRTRREQKYQDLGAIGPDGKVGE